MTIERPKALNLPVPTKGEVEEFKKIYKEEFGKDLSNEEAWDAATRTLQLFYLATYGLQHSGASATGPLGSSGEASAP